MTTAPGPRRMSMFARPPSRWSKIAGPLGFCCLLAWLALPLLWTRMTFTPSTEWSAFRWIPITLVALSLGIWLGHWAQENARRVGKTISLFMRVTGFYILIPLIMFWYAWCNVGFVLPGIFTHFVGATRHEVATLHKYYREHTRRSFDCEYRVEGTPFLESRERYYCAWQREWEALPVSGEMDIRFRSSWLGRRYEYVAPHDPSLHRAG